MSKQTSGRKKDLKRGFVCTAAAVVCTFVLSAFSGIFSAKSGSEAARILSDSCFFVGALCLGAAGLFRASRAGIFDGVAYVVKLLPARSFFRRPRGERESYAEFREKRKNSPPVSLWFLAAVGFFLLALASVFLFIFFHG